MLSKMVTWVFIIALAITLACLFLYVRQDRLLFYPRPNDAALREHWKWQRVEIASGDHVLEGWWADGGAPESSLIALYFGGNAEDVLYTASQATRFDVKRLLVVNYRGYGNSPGRPSQVALYQDALAIYDYAVDAGGADAKDVVVMGRSLGSGVAAMLAAERTVRAAVLITPYDSITAVASRHYPEFLVTRLLRHPFPSTEYAARARVPALLLVAANDAIIPPVHAQALAKQWAGRREIHILDNVGHNSIEQHPDYYRLLNGFLRNSTR